MELVLAELSEHERYKLLTALVVPRPIAWISTVNDAGIANCAPFSFFNVLGEEPPLLVVSFGPRSDGAEKHSLKNIRRTGEFVVNLVDEETANAMHASSAEVPEEQSEFALTGLTPAPAKLVRHPRIAEARVSFECRVYRTMKISHEREFVFGEILLIHARDGIVDPRTKRIDEAQYQPVGRLYANRYCTTRERFALPGALPPRRS